ncbi:hypothetical protein VNO77_33602 [Canavalia gladiata]|uniref:Uncharacterized protein n=1 Tax=Canavalia gladiata TaxID=3824 RepID=A0AAN9KC49_CANGL
MQRLTMRNERGQKIETGSSKRNNLSVKRTKLLAVFSRMVNVGLRTEMQLEIEIPYPPTPKSITTYTCDVSLVCWCMPSSVFSSSFSSFSRQNIAWFIAIAPRALSFSTGLVEALLMRLLLYLLLESRTILTHGGYLKNLCLSCKSRFLKKGKFSFVL